jgi:mevalonate kinase
MKWSIPAKTFFLGEYAAIAGAPAIILTTSPCFEVTLTHEPGLQGIHPESPAGRLWTEQGPADQGLLWHDPYHGRGGLGASSAQWLGAYRAVFFSRDKGPMGVSSDEMLQAYFHSAWSGIGMRPSGYDVWAQSLQGCVYLHGQKAFSHGDIWPFDDLAFILVHTGKKLATHQHLQALALSSQMEPLIQMVESAKSAFESGNSMRVIDAVNAYHQQLLQMGLVASHSLEQIDAWKAHPDVLAIKGCGAMGADVLLLLVPRTRLAAFSAHLKSMKQDVLATSEQLYFNQ